MPRDGVFAFGPFQFDGRSKRLFKGGAAVSLSLRQLDLLHLLISRAGEVVTKDELVAFAWKDVTVTDNSLVKALMEMRRALDADPDRYILSVTRRGYRFAADLQHVFERRTTADLDALLAADRALVEGSAALATLTRDEIPHARTLFELAVARDPDDPAYHVGLANACLFQYDASQFDAEPDLESLRLAEAHVRQACALNAEHADALSTLGMILDRMGDGAGAIAALRRAVKLDPASGLHHLQLTWVSWGEARLIAARNTLARSPDLPLARMLAAAVYVATDSLTDAEREIDAGLAAMRGETQGSARFSAVGLDWLKGELLLARDEDAEAMAAFERELRHEATGHLYAREYAAHAHYGIGVCHMRAGNAGAATAAFQQTLTRMPGHPRAQAGLTIVSEPRRSEPRAFRPGDVRMQDPRPEGRGLRLEGRGLRLEGRGPRTDQPQSLEAALGDAALVSRGDAAAAASIVGTALAAAPPGKAGWFIPLDPLLDVQHNKAAWADVLALLKTRAR